ncbi:GTP-binding protein [Rubrimonas cliftonensis]|uniref:GTPase Der n=2 Tax=Rubrimonas cliftonensis TaxID=89524 RepID=A0A1H3ZEC4_9RHOB|nr:GTP-binding protein [Rubrimonas cliftonensis]
MAYRPPAMSPSAPTFKLAIVGRPNVGKSTLFNRLVGKRLALVDDQPGVTRDLREGEGKLADLRFIVVDTAGLEDVDDDSLQARMRRLTDRAVAEADVVLFVIDARAGVTPLDQTFADILRRRGGRILLGANKAEGRAGLSGAMEAYSLGLGEPIPFSAEHGEGMEALYAALQPIADTFADEAALITAQAPETNVALPEVLGEEDESDGVADPSRPIQIAVVGRPNAGKSTLVNAILGEERLLTGPEAGITRDAIGLEIDWGGRPFRVFDTAGMRKKARVQEKLEKLSVGDGLRAVRYAEVVVVLLDVASSFEQQDLRIADLAEREGRAVVIAVNKWDLEKDKSARLRELREAFDRLLPQLKGAPLVTVSAIEGRGLDRLREAVLKVHATWNRRIATAKLNRWLGDRVAEHAPPAPSGRRIRLRYMTQVKSRPPSFLAFCNKPEDLPESYTRFLVNGLRRDFGLDGVPIRFSYRKTENPYDRK